MRPWDLLDLGRMDGSVRDCDISKRHRSKGFAAPKDWSSQMSMLSIAQSAPGLSCTSFPRPHRASAAWWKSARRAGSQPAAATADDDTGDIIISMTHIMHYV